MQKKFCYVSFWEAREKHHLPSGVQQWWFYEWWKNYVPDSLLVNRRAVLCGSVEKTLEFVERMIVT